MSAPSNRDAADQTTTYCSKDDCTWPCRHHTHADRINGYSIIYYQYQDAPKFESRACTYCCLLGDILRSTCACSLKGPADVEPSNSKPCQPQRASLYVDRSVVRRLFARWTCGSQDLAIGYGPSCVNDKHSGSIAVSGHTSALMPSVLPFLPLVPPSNDVETTIRKCQAWYAECCSSHEACSGSDSATFPRRVLDLTDTASTSRVRLRETDGLSGQYTALSYCWGGTKPSLTTTSNYESRMSGMNSSDLPVCYQDAIAVTLKLGIKYLWIDALAIIQDDPQDWQKEVYVMDQIFRNAAVVIVAAAALNPFQSFLDRTASPLWASAEYGPRQGSRRWTKAFQLQGADESACVQVQVAPRHTFAQGKDACVQLPMETRAWIFQEHLMARRSLIFRAEEVIWRCAKGCECECSSSKCYYDAYVPDEPMRRGTAMDSNLALRFWVDRSVSYSLRKLSVDTDRLPALSALAKAFASSIGGSYLAGMWRERLVPQLCWNIRYPESAVKPYSVYVAPSWSWASHPTATQLWTEPLHDENPQDDANETCKVVDAWCSLAGSNPFGAVSSGILVLSGHVCKAQLSTAGCLRTTKYDLTLEDGRRFTDVERPLFGLDYVVQTVDMNVDTRNDVRTLQPGDAVSLREQHACSGAVVLLHLISGFIMVLAYSQQEPGAFRRLGLWTRSRNARKNELDEVEVVSFDHWECSEVRIV